MKKNLLRSCAALFSFVCLLSLSLSALASGQSTFCEQGLNYAGSTVRETDLGNFVADAVLETAHTDVALIPGSLLCSSLKYGTVTEESIAALFESDCHIFICTMSVAELTALLEESVSHWVTTDDETLDESRSAWDGFLQVSGIRFRAGASLMPYARVQTLYIGENEVSPDDEEQQLTVAMAAVQAPSDVWQDTDFSLVQAVTDYAMSQDSIQPSDDSYRIRILSVRENELISYVPAAAWPILLVLVAASAIIGLRRKRLTETPCNND